MTVSTQPRDGVLRTPDERFAAITDYPYAAHYIDVEPGLRMAYVDAGPADATETVFLLHGEPMWGYLYRSMIPPLVEAGLRVIVPDLIGFGRSDKPIEQTDYTYSNHVRWVNTLIEQLDLTNMTFFGQDWGGLIGGRVVADNNARFSRAVFSNTGLPGSGPALPGLQAQQPFSGEQLQAMLGIDWRATVTDDDHIDPDLVHAFVVPGPAFYFPAWRVYSQEVAELWPSKVVAGWCLTPVCDSTLAAYDAPFPTQQYCAGARRFPMLVPITADDVERLNNDAAWAVLEQWTTKPVLTVWGDHCPHTRLQAGADFRSRIPGASLPGVEHTVYTASHFIQEDCGPQVADEIVQLIGRFPT